MSFKKFLILVIVVLVFVVVDILMGRNYLEAIIENVIQILIVVLIIYFVNPKKKKDY